MKQRNLSFFIIFNLFSHIYLTHPTQAIETIAREAIMIDMDTGASLFEKNADQMMPPASMSKLMTLYLLLQELKEGNLNLDDKFLVSERAWRLGGAKSGSSTMFLEPQELVTIRDLIRGIIIQSGNDACIVVAENLAETETLFAEAMNAKAIELGMFKSVFKNSTGWPHPEHKMSPRDLTILAKRIITDFPDYYFIFKEKEFTYNGIKQFNRNPLLYNKLGVDGLKTGYTSDAGYGLVASAKRGKRRIIIVVNGLKSKKTRKKEPERLLDWAFQKFNNYILFNAGETVDKAKVWLGKSSEVPLIIQKELKLTIKRNLRSKMKVILSLNSPIEAPIKKGDIIAKLKVVIPKQEQISIDLASGRTIERLGFMGRMHAIFTHLIWGHSG